jgi:hypothetical protein
MTWRTAGEKSFFAIGWRDCECDEKIRQSAAFAKTSAFVNLQTKSV